jgi:peroxiredoxin-like protein
MPAVTHAYPVSLNWTGGRDGRGELVASHSGEKIGIAVPEEFQGTGGATNPEELLTCAITGCYGMTFGIIAANRKLPVTDIKVEAVGEVEQNGASFTYTAITVKPTITVSADATDDQIAVTEDMAHKADLYCIITNAVRGKVEIKVEPTIVKA